jgi:uncharacterized protein (TIGR00255 family)
MTGFGLAEDAVGAGRMSVEIRTVNHRHFAAQFRLPSECQRFESDMRERLRARIDRGHVSVAMRWTEQPTADGAVSLDLERARAVREALQRLASELGMSDVVDLGFVARQPDVLTFGSADPVTIEADPVLALIDTAAAQVLDAREREGAVLAADLSGRLDLMEAKVAVIEERAPGRVVAERDRLRAAVAELLDGSQLDENRLAQEIAFLADKLDITEEIVRLRTHIGAFREALASNEAVGRRLSFLGQEMLREVNTIGSKANDAVIAEAVIDMKSELEKVREQVENLE